VVAVIGASRDRRKFGNKAVRAFQAAGDTVVPIHPREEQIEGVRAYRSVLDVPGPIDMATVYLPAATALTVLPQLQHRGVGDVWLNPGADDDTVVEAARGLGLHVTVACSIIGVGQHPSRY
jgi:predicted CoA-binding protein